MRDIALVSVIVGLLPFCIWRPWIGILTWNWVGLMNPHRLTFGFAYSFPFAQLVAAATLLGWLFTKEKKGIPRNREMGLLVVMTLYFAVTSFFAWAPDRAWDRWFDFVKMVLMAIVGTSVIYGERKIRWLVAVIVFSIGYYGVKGGIWAILTGGAERVMGPDGSFMSGNTGIGLAIAMVIPLIVALAREQIARWRRVALYAAVVLCAVATLFTYSRGAWLGLAVVLLLLFFAARKKFLVALVMIPALVLASALNPEKVFQRADTLTEYEEDASAMQRIQSWTVAWNIAKDHPLVGAGFHFETAGSARWLGYADPSLLAYLDHAAAAHSIYFQLLGQHGFVGLALFLGLLLGTIATLARIKRLTKDAPELGWAGNYASALQIGLVSYMVSGTFLSVAYFDLFYLYVTLSAILHREASALQPKKFDLPRPRDSLLPGERRPFGQQS